MSQVLFKTVHGSHLYGLAHEGSDEDFYVVLSKVKIAKAKYAKQKIHDGVDTMTVDFGTWVGQCRDGVPQALEAMFSSMPEHDEIGAFRYGFRVGTTAHERYLRTITSFAMNQDYKRKRHALRLALNFVDLKQYGRFNPTLTDDQVDFVSDYAHKDVDCVYGRAMMLAQS
jgi:hypothetical protein